MKLSMNPPDQALARRILSRVAYRERLPAGRFMPHLGMLRGDVRSLPELYLLLTPEARSLPGVNLRSLSGWVKRIVGDHELADALQKISEPAESYVEGCLRAYELVGIRLKQARNAAGQED
jgi:hypothetical protein